MRALCSIWDLGTGQKEYFNSLDANSYQEILENIPSFVDFCDDAANEKVDMLWCVTEVSCTKQLHRIFTEGVILEMENSDDSRVKKKHKKFIDSVPRETAIRGSVRDS